MSSELRPCTRSINISEATRANQRGVGVFRIPSLVPELGGITLRVQRP